SALMGMNLTSPSYSFASFSRMGLVLMQGAHHAAQKSTMMGSSVSAIIFWNSELFMMNGSGGRLPSPPGLVLFPVGAEFEQRVERTERDHRGEQEDDAQHQQDNAERSRHNSAEIQVGEERGDHNTDNSVNIGHIAFHEISPLENE